MGNVRFSTGSDLFILQARISVAIGVNYGLKLEREQLSPRYSKELFMFADLWRELQTSRQTKELCSTKPLLILSNPANPYRSK